MGAHNLRGLLIAEFLEYGLSKLDACRRGGEENDQTTNSRSLIIPAEKPPANEPNRSTTLLARSGCDEPLNTLMFGILLYN